MRSFLYCPKCGSGEVWVDSSRDAGCSWVDCSDCDYRFQRSVNEETLEEKWNALKRKPQKQLLISSIGEAEAKECYPDLFMENQS